MTRMHAVVVALCAGLSLALAEPAPAQTNIRIGYVNINFVLQNAPQTQALNQTMTAEFASREAEFVAQQEAWNTKGENYQRDAAVMAQSERAALERELERERLELQRTQTALQEDVEIRQTELVNELQATIAQRVQAFAVLQGYDLILTNQSVAYASEAIDVTEELLTAISTSSTAGSTPAPASTTTE
jgi:outer membrane protein